MKTTSFPIQERATTSEIFTKLEELLGSDAVIVVKQVQRLTDSGENLAALSNIKEYDASLGGIGIYSISDNKKLLGVYRALSYVQFPFLVAEIKNQTRSMVHSSCVYLEELLKKIVRAWIWERTNVNALPLGVLANRSKKYFPPDLVANLFWLNNKVYVFAKHHYNFEEDGLEPEYYFSVGEAVAVYLIVRKLGLEMEKLSGKTLEELQQG